MRNLLHARLSHLALQRQNERLEVMVDQRTAELEREAVVASEENLHELVQGMVDRPLTAEERRLVADAPPHHS